MMTANELYFIIVAVILSLIIAIITLLLMIDKNDKVDYYGN